MSRVKVILCYTCSLLFILVPLCAISVKASNKQVLPEIPLHWDSSYIEDYEAYEDNYAFDAIEWGTVTPESVEEFYTVTIPDTVLVYQADAAITNRTKSDIEIALLQEDDAWSYISDGLWTNYPKGSFNSNKNKLEELRNKCTETITIRVWTWANPKDENDLRKVTATKVLAVNSKLADTFKHIFEDIYNHEERPVINLSDTGMGTWVLRGKNHDSSRSASAHSFGAAVDINPSTGSFYINGTWYGNAYGQKKMPYAVWNELPNIQKKYNVVYDGCPMVEIFKSYGFYWGGDWKTSTDAMHFAYIGDGSSARSTGINNYKERN